MDIEQHVTTWTVKLHLSDQEGHTHAEARLMAGNHAWPAVTGRAELSPQDPEDVAEVGYELAAGRALLELGRQLVEAGLADAADVPETEVGGWRVSDLES
ncbi:dsRBD fold-containing protein [Nocardioides dilutus]